MKVAIITGLSGAGRSRTVDWFEDQGYYCVDNMPPKLIRNFIELGKTSESTMDKVAFVTDIRSKEFFKDLEKVIDELKDTEGIDCDVIFVEAATATLVKRYNETRRLHPLTGGQASASVIEEERDRLKTIRRRADLIIDTTNLKVAGLNAELNKKILGGVTENTFSLNIMSFGFKYGIPTEADIVVDMRFLPNPYYVSSLKKLTGNNKKIQSFVFKSELATVFLDNFEKTVEAIIPGYIKEGKYHLNIAFGCTGGHHRSVAMANALADRFASKGMRISVVHRDLDLQGKGR